MNRNNIFLSLIILSSQSFYNFQYLPIPEIAFKALYIFFIILSFIVLNKKTNLLYRKDCSQWLMMLIIIEILSIYSSYAFENQSLGIGLMSTLPYTFTLCVFFLMKKNNISRLEILHIISLFAIIYVILTLINRVFPEPIFGTKDFDVTRGSMRYFLSGLHWFILFWLLKIQSYKKTNNRKELFWIVFGLFIIILSVTRQIIIFSFFIGLLLYTIGNKWKKNVVICIVAVFIGIIVPQIPMVNRMVELTVQQQENNQDEDDIRIQAWNYYTKQYKRNTYEHIMGCGVPSVGNSYYGNKIEKATEENLFFIHDVGWAGFYLLFGLSGVICMIMVMIRAIFIKVDSNLLPYKLYVLLIGLLSFASGPILYWSQTLPLIFCIYVLSIKDKVTYGRINHNSKL